MFANIAAGLKAADSFLWGPPLLILLLGTHLFYTVRLRFIQRHLGTAFKLIAKQDGQLSGNVAPFAALAVALASTIGTGNVVGVATAIALGGPGAVFWCMVTGIFGMATKYAESLLAVKYRVKDESETVHGGPMYTILNGLHWRWMAVLFCIVASIAVLGTGNLVQSNAIATAVSKAFNIPAWSIGIGVALLIGLVVIGGLKSIAKVCSWMVPLCLWYILPDAFIFCASTAVFSVIQLCLSSKVLSVQRLPQAVSADMELCWLYSMVWHGDCSQMKPVWDLNPLWQQRLRPAMLSGRDWSPIRGHFARSLSVL